MYVVAGVTGNTGKVAANVLLDRGQKVRVIVRDATKGQAFAARGAEVAVADLGDEAALTRALAGATGAYFLIPPNATSQNFRAYQDQTARAIAGALRTAKVPHVVLLSSVGADVPSGTGPIAGLFEAEKVLRALPETKATFLRAGYFTENLATSFGALEQGILPTFMPAKAPMEMIATRDIGELAASLLLEGRNAPEIVQLAGAPVTTEEAAEIVSKIVGKPIRVQEAPLDALVPTLTGFGISADVAGLYREMFEAFGTGKIQWDASQRKILGKTSVETVVRGILQPG
jgi:uncharacterized protein YbjT (DUF2867 family)